MEYENDPLYRAAKSKMEEEFKTKRETGTLSKVHDESHTLAVATFGSATARGLVKGQGYDDVVYRWGLLTSLAGLLHDIKRCSVETEPHGPAGALYFKGIISEEPWSELTEKESDAIYRAIEEHEKSFGEIENTFGKPIGKKDIILPSVVAHGILTGDKALEASGARVLERRSFFVGKERMEKDITVFKYPDESHLAVLGETMIRLYKRNPIDQYPLWLRNFSQEWHSIQYMFYKGLLEYTEMSEEQCARYMFKKDFPRFDEDCLYRVQTQKHLSGNFFDERYPILSKKIKELSYLSKNDLLDLAESSHKFVKTFSTSESPEEAISSYDPEADNLKYYKNFMNMVIDYRTGKISEDFEENITRTVHDIVSNPSLYHY